MGVWLTTPAKKSFLNVLFFLNTLFSSSISTLQEIDGMLKMDNRTEFNNKTICKYVGRFKDPQKVRRKLDGLKLFPLPGGPRAGTDR